MPRCNDDRLRLCEHARARACRPKPTTGNAKRTAMRYRCACTSAEIASDSAPRARLISNRRSVPGVREGEKETETDDGPRGQHYARQLFAHVTCGNQIYLIYFPPPPLLPRPRSQLVPSSPNDSPGMIVAVGQAGEEGRGGGRLPRNYFAFLNSRLSV